MPRYINADLTNTEILNAVQEETADADTFITVRRILNKLPTADVAPVIHAKIFIADDGFIRCSACGKDMRYPAVSFRDIAYCPRCGAKIDKEEQDAT